MERNLTHYAADATGRGGSLRLQLIVYLGGYLNFQTQTKPPEGKGAADTLLTIPIIMDSAAIIKVDIITDSMRETDKGDLWLHFNSGRAGYVSSLHFSHCKIVHTN